MPEHIRALIAILLLSTIVFAFASKPACELINRADFSRRRNAWFVITLVAFLAHNFWVYVLLATFVTFVAKTKESSPAALFFILLFAVPTGGVEIPGMGIVNYFFILSHQRLLSLVILLPAFFTLIGQRSTLPFGRTTPDKLLAAYLILVVGLYLRETTFTDTMRQGLYQFIDVFLPYYVISRLLKKPQDFREALLCFVVAVMVLALIGVFESVKHWLLYGRIEQILGIGSRFMGYGDRAGLTRAGASVDTIPLGYLMTIGIGFYLYLQQFIHSKLVKRMGFFLLLAGLFASLSRGPWVGAVFLFIVFIFTGQRAMGNMVKFIGTGLLVLTIISFLPSGERIINLIPYVGETAKENITYRERLIENALIVINRHPWFGSIDYLETPEMESMRQGQGIIDIVNTYIAITLESGYIGLSMFVGFFIMIVWGIFRSFRHFSIKTNREELLLGRALLATLGSILLIIFTVSSVSIIPIMYWSVAGLGAAYINMSSRRVSAKSETKGPSEIYSKTAQSTDEMIDGNKTS